MLMSYSYVCHCGSRWLNGSVGILGILGTLWCNCIVWYIRLVRGGVGKKKVKKVNVSSQRRDRDFWLRDLTIDPKKKNKLDD